MAAVGLVGTEVALLDEVEGDLDGERLLKLAVDGARAPESCFERGCAGVPFGACEWWAVGAGCEALFEIVVRLWKFGVRALEGVLGASRMDGACIAD